jgi:hypothetical protein
VAAACRRAGLGGPAVVTASPVVRRRLAGAALPVAADDGSDMNAAVRTSVAAARAAGARAVLVLPGDVPLVAPADLDALAARARAARRARCSRRLLASAAAEARSRRRTPSGGEAGGDGGVGGDPAELKASSPQLPAGAHGAGAGQRAQRRRAHRSLISSPAGAPVAGSCPGSASGSPPACPGVA